jgi:hypothetical protein
MGWPVVSVASGGLPVVETTRGLPVSEAANGRGVAVTKVTGRPALPVTFETIGIVAPPITPTALNPSDKDSHITLSGNNLTAAGTAGWTGLVRAVSGKTSGKYYWEATFNAAAAQSGVGVALSTLPVATTTFSNVSTGKCGLVQNATVFVDGASTFSIDGVGGSSIVFGAIASGTVICVAVDLDVKEVWYRLGAAGNWNNSAARNPATGVGGANIPTVTTAYPTLCFGGADSITANFGATAFVGTVPAGFTSGWPV